MWHSFGKTTKFWVFFLHSWSSMKNCNERILLPFSLWDPKNNFIKYIPCKISYQRIFLTRLIGMSLSWCHYQVMTYFIFWITAEYWYLFVNHLVVWVKGTTAVVIMKYSCESIGNMMCGHCIVILYGVTVRYRHIICNKWWNVVKWFIVSYFTNDHVRVFSSRRHE